MYNDWVMLHQPDRRKYVGVPVTSGAMGLHTAYAPAQRYIGTNKLWVTPQLNWSGKKFELSNLENHVTNDQKWV